LKEVQSHHKEIPHELIAKEFAPIGINLNAEAYQTVSRGQENYLRRVRKKFSSNILRESILEKKLLFSAK